MTAEQALIDLYRRAARRLRARIQQDLESGRIGSAVYRQRQLATITVELRRLGQRAPALVTAAVMEAYGAGAAVADLGATSRFEFNAAHRRNAAVLARNLSTDTLSAVNLVGRRAADAYRRAGLEAATEQLVAGAPRREISEAMARRLVRDRTTDALTGFVDRAGRRWQLDVYTEMATRTTTRETVSAATRERMLETDQDLVTISSHGTTTPICQEYEGNTYSITGDTEGYEILDAWPPFHPNCLHVATPGAADLDESLQLLASRYGVTLG